MILFSTCRNVTLEDVLITNAPFWRNGRGERVANIRSARGR
jgi:hypothetical protein